MATKRTLKPLYDANDWSRAVEVPSSGKEPWRSDVRRDYARLIHSPSFRRLQGKTQLFPSHESDFFRNRLTHSLEVAQIAKSIAIKLNATSGYFQKHPIDTDLVEFAALAHDIGHPPFGHNGEAVLDRLMINDGGFEGNAQTLRILACTEKKETASYPSLPGVPVPVDGDRKTDERKGLNLTFRTLASILKYDVSIPFTKKARSTAGNVDHPCKGYYSTEKTLVEQIREKIIGDKSSYIKTLECSIMDVADDIAYSTYDIEDSFKAGFLSPLSMLAAPDAFKDRIAERVKRRTAHLGNRDEEFTRDHVNNVLRDIFYDILRLPDRDVALFTEGAVELISANFIMSAHSFETSKEIGRNGYLRAQFTSQLVGRFINAVELNFNDEVPKLSSVRLDLETARIVETLKSFSFQQLIESPMLKLAERRGKEVIEKIFVTLEESSELLPDDWKEVYNSIDDGGWHRRVVCDYISGMTDRYCVEMYARITGYDPMTIWKPH